VRAPHMMWAGDAACAIVPQADRDKAWRSSGGLREGTGYAVPALSI
jgi:hypothetical protein